MILARIRGALDSAWRVTLIIPVFWLGCRSKSSRCQTLTDPHRPVDGVVGVEVGRGQSDVGFVVRYFEPSTSTNRMTNWCVNANINDQTLRQTSKLSARSPPPTRHRAHGDPLNHWLVVTLTL